MKTKLQLLICLLFCVLTTTCQATTLHLSVAASMTDVIKEVISEFAGAHPEAKILPNFASSGSLAKQISHGAPADIYISANPRWMQYLLDNKQIAQDTDTIFAFNKLVFVSDRTGDNVSFPSLLGMERIAIGDPKSVPAGGYAQQAMKNGGIYDQLRKEKKFVFAKDVRQALLYADRGEVDGAFVYKTDALLAQHAKIVFSVPDDLYSRVAYPVGLTVQGAGKELAKEFYDFITGDRVADILNKYGFEAARQHQDDK